MDWLAVVFVVLIILSNLIGAMNKKKGRPPGAGRPTTPGRDRMEQPMPMNRPMPPRGEGAPVSERPSVMRPPESVMQRPPAQPSMTSPQAQRTVRQLPSQQPGGARTLPPTQRAPSPRMTSPTARPVQRRPQPRQVPPPPPKPVLPKPASEESFAAATDTTYHPTAVQELLNQQARAVRKTIKPLRLRFSDDDLVNGLILSEILGRPPGLAGPGETSPRVG